MISGAERNRCVFRKKTQRFLFFYFQREQQRKDEPNEKKEKPMVRRFDTDCRSAGHHSLYPWKCVGVASCRSFCHLGGMGNLLFPCSVYQGGASQTGGKAHPQKMRKAGCGLRPIHYPRSVRPCGAGTASPCQLSHFSLSAIGIPQRNLGVA